MVYVPWSTQFGATTSASDVVIGAGVEVEVAADTVAREVTVQAGGKLRLAPGTTCTLTVHGSLHVKDSGSLLTMRPNLGQTHTVRFAGVDEEATVGTSSNLDHAFKATDKGLWVMHGAQVDLGDVRERRPYTRLSGAATAGQASITLAETPTNWQVGDRLIIAPTTTPQDRPSDWWKTFDDRTITGINGNTITLSAALTYNHPVMSTDGPAPTGWTLPLAYAAEVLNLTRDVRIEGLPTGRAHVNVHSTATQYLKNVAIRHVGPQKSIGGGKRDGVLGRYGLHLHFAGDQAASTYENIVISECGFRSFVTHKVDNARLLRCIAHDGQAEQFWWDLSNSRDANGVQITVDNDSNGVTWEKCVASHMYPPTGLPKYRMTQYNFSNGIGNKCIDCIAFGEGAGGESSGYGWPEGDEDVWIFERNIVHNGKNSGLFVWQNNSLTHLIDDFAAFNCLDGVNHGAYQNAYEYRRAVLVGMKSSGVVMHASSGAAKRMRLSDFLIDGKGFAHHHYTFLHPNLDPSLESVVERFRCLNLGPRNAALKTGYAVTVKQGVGSDPNIAFLRDWTFDSSVTIDNLVLWQSPLVQGDVLKFRNSTVGPAPFFDVRHADSGIGTLDPDWNALVQILEVDDQGSEADGTTPRFTEAFEVADQTEWPAARWQRGPSSGSVGLSVVNAQGRVTLPSAIGAFQIIEPLPSNLIDPAADSQISALIDWTGKGTGLGRAQLWQRATGTTQANWTGYRVDLVNNSKQVRLEQVVNGTNTLLGALELGQAPAEGVRHRIKFRIEAGRMKVRGWLDGTPEPTLWQVDVALPASPITSGKPWLTAIRSSGTTSFGFDDVRLADYLPPPTETLDLRLTASPFNITVPPNGTATVQVGTTDGNIAAFDVVGVPSWLSVTPMTGLTPVNLTMSVLPGQPSGPLSGFVLLASPTHDQLKLPVFGTASILLRRLVKLPGRGLVRLRLPS